MRRLCSGFLLILMMAWMFSAIGITGCGDDTDPPGGGEDVMADGGPGQEDVAEAKEDVAVKPDILVDDAITGDGPGPEVTQEDVVTADIISESCDGIIDECPAGQFCVPDPDGEGTFICTILPIEPNPGEACDSRYDCGGGLGCVGVEGETFCRTYCTPSDAGDCESQEGYLCSPFADFEDLGACVPREDECEVCDPEIEGTIGCDPGEKCTLGMSGLTCDPIADHPATQGDRCGQAGGDNCGDGLICSGSDPSNFVCSPLCEPLSPSDEDCCDGLCIGFYGYEEVNLGVCINCTEECDVYCQTGCDEGQKCTLISDCSTGCVEAGDLPLGESCGAMGFDDCAPGLFCDGSSSTCVQMCRTDLTDDGCDGDSTCISFDPYGMISAGYCGHFPSYCSARDQDCEDGQKCTLDVVEGAYAITCVDAGEVGAGELCGGAGDDCAPGFMCLGSSEDDMTCMKVCEPLSGMTGCEGNEICSEIGGVPKGANIGYCVAWIEECSVRDQDCAEGQKCTMAMEGLECVEVCGDLGLGEVCGTCATGDDCAEGYMCAGTSELFTCSLLCEPKSDESGCPDGASCVGFYGYEEFNFGVCQIYELSCDPLNDECAEGHCGLTPEGTGCLTEGGLVQQGEVCTGDVDCASGLVCISIADPCKYTCEPFCDIYGDPCEASPSGDSRVCAWLGIGDLGVCVEMVYECDILSNEPCVDGEKCIFTGYGIECVPLTGTLQEGEECGFAGDDCDVGMTCAGTEDKFTCMRMCKPLSEGGCGEDALCLGFFGMETIDYGVCQNVRQDCSPLCQSGCVDGEKCTYGPDGVQCLPDGTKGLGEPCGETEGVDDDCMAGTICLGSEEDGYTCRLVCEPEIATIFGSASCGPNEICFDLGDGGLLPIGYCETFPQPCSIFDQNCAAGERCVLAEEPDENDLYGTTCVPAGQVGWMQPCNETDEDVTNDCALGLICLTSGGESTCFELCDPVNYKGCDSCFCDTDAACQEGCPCDTDCVCECDTDSACQGDCECDTDCFAQYCTYFGHPALGAPVGFCQPYTYNTCSIANQDCGADETCSYYIDTNRCMKAGTLPLAAACDPYNDECGPGMTCSGSGGVFQCMRICEPQSDDAVNGCPNEEICVGFINLPTVNYGICLSMDNVACDLIANDCASGERCSYGSAGTICVPAGTGGLHEPCVEDGSAEGGCGTGYMCTDKSFFLPNDWDACSVCEVPCYVGAGDATGCPAESPLCEWNMVGPPESGLGVCGVQEHECSVLDLGSCPAGERCSLGAFVSLRCMEDGPLQTGDSCTGAEPCGAGTECFGTDSGDFTCQQLCEPFSPDPGCPTGMDCYQVGGWSALPPAGAVAVNVGVCVGVTVTCEILQSGCPDNPPEGMTCCEEGEKCVASLSGTFCMESGTVEEGGMCTIDETTYLDNCGPALMCSDFNGYCLRLCEPASAVTGCEGEARCQRILGMPMEINVGLCETIIPSCDPIAQDCDEGQKCAIGMGGYTCQAEGDKALDDVCGEGNADDCMAGLVCIGSDEGGYTCQTLCQAASGAGCSEGQTCQGVLGMQGYGYCYEFEVDCSVRDQDCETETDKCALGMDGIVCVADGDAAVGDLCEATMESDTCAKGGICMSFGTVGLCMGLCEPQSNPTGCGGGMECGEISGFEGVNVGVCTGNECSINDQDCDAEQKCTIGAFGTVCEADGDVALDEPCGEGAVLDDCMAGLICIGNEDEGYTCQILCEPTNPTTCVGEDQVCLDLIGDGSAGYCETFVAECSILAQDCNLGQKCTIGMAGIECAPAGNSQAGETCGQGGVDNCAAGLLCAGTGTAFECMTLCEPQSDPNGCGELEPCLMLSGMEHLNVGVCGEGPGCDIVAQDCDTGNKCTLNWRTMVVECMPDGTLANGETCQYLRDQCQAGLLCVPITMTEAVCSPLCGATAEVSGCGEDQFCMSIDPGNTMGMEYVGTCGTYECSVVAQDCDEGLQCTIGMMGIECVPDGTLPLGENCSAGGECAAGGICAGSDGVYFCMELCEPMSEIQGCSGNLVCMGLYGMEAVNVGVCEDVDEDCNPISQSGCDAGSTCYPWGEDYPDVTLCLEAGTAPAGDPCEYDCAEGIICWYETPEDLEGVCRVPCNPGGGVDCAEGVCETMAIGEQDWGLCY